MTSPPALAWLSFTLDDKVGEAGARRLLAREPRGFRFWRTTQEQDAGGAPALELVLLPVAIAQTRPRVEGGGRRASRARVDPGGKRVRIYVVERVLGHAWALSHDLVEDDGLGKRPDCDNGAEPLPSRLTIADCRKPIDVLASRAALAFGRGRPGDVAELGPLQAASYPFWLRYRRDRRGRVDFAALDAVTGSRPGSAVRAAIAAALIDADGA